LAGLFCFSTLAWADRVAGPAQAALPHSHEETARNADCFQPDTLSSYSKSPRVMSLTQRPNKILKTGHKIDQFGTVVKAMQANFKFEHDDQIIEASERESADDDMRAESEKKVSVRSAQLPIDADGAQSWLSRNGFHNLMNCKQWVADHAEAWEDKRTWPKIHKGLEPYLAVPKGAVLVYAGRGQQADRIEISTPAGFWPNVESKKLNRSTFLSPDKYELVGVYVRPADDRADTIMVNSPTETPQ
jgi:hypothetical protein